ncbi:MAG: hypothetical protein GEV12_09175 [Micromonosporaceae bacterium]|nr:hypothetical protein [Micromonosporaceae bacterium]
MVAAELSSLMIIVALLSAFLVRTGRRRLLRASSRAVKLAWSLAVGLLWLLLTGAGLWTLSELAVDPAPVEVQGDPCPSGVDRTFNVSLINVPLFLNRFGDVVPEGRMYVLDENIDQVRTTFQNAADPFAQKDLIEPLVLRVNRGDCVDVSFTNRLHEPAPDFNRNDSIFLLDGETLRAPGTVTPDPREFAPAATEPDEFDPVNAPPASMHFDGLSFDVTTSDGTAVGNNPNSTAQPGDTVVYRLFADLEGEFQFKDGADLSSHQANAGRFIGSTGFGAFGGIIVEPEGAGWVDTNTGVPLTSGTRAIITQPNRPDFRENVLFMHDEVEAEPGILTRFCVPGGGWNRNEDDGAEDNNGDGRVGGTGDACVRPGQAEIDVLSAGTFDNLSGGDADALVNGEIPVKLEWFAFNYRAEPGFNREEVGCPALDDPTIPFQAPACIGEETSLSSWPFGDPGGGDLVFHGYRNEPTVQRLFHTAEQETHTFHQHVHRWPFDPEDEGGQDQIFDRDFGTQVTNPIDVQAVSPGSHYTLVPEGGLGSPDGTVDGSVGDIIFHCHLYPHFANGMWGLNRSHDVLETGGRLLPDGTEVLALQPLADFDSQPEVPGTNPPPEPSPATPGFPFFVPGEFGFKGPKPPLGVPSRQDGAQFPPTALERNAAADDAQVPGAFFVDHCPDGAPVKPFEVVAVQPPRLEYNDELQWTNPQPRVYVLADDRAAVEAGVQRPEPFSPLLNVGDCVEYHLTNGLPEDYGGTVFDRFQETNEVSIHQHMVEFDVLSSDGAANGWNYDQGADAEVLPGEDDEIVFRNYVQAPVRTNSFHDHLFPNVTQDAGLFGGGSVHPAGCTFHDPISGEPVEVGTIVDVRCPGGDDDYRNVSLFIEDQVAMFQPEDDLGNPNDEEFIDQFATDQLGFDAVPIFPAKFPSSSDDKGVMGVNYSLEPFEARKIAGPANLFDSKLHGDPFTPMPRAFAGDRVVFRLFQLSQEESHGFNLHRLRWEFEPDDPESQLVQAQHIGMLEYFESRIPTDKENEDPKGFELRDYLYNYGGADDWFLGAWGLMRVSGCDFHGQLRDLEDIYAGDIKFDRLQQLPDNPVANCQQQQDPVERLPGNPCQAGAPVREYDVVAFNQDIFYNDMQDSNDATFEHDPNGVMYALAEDEAAIRAGTKPPEPLVLRANQGDCIEVTLTNNLDPSLMRDHCFEAIEPGQLALDAANTYPECIDEPPRNEVNVPGFFPLGVSPLVSLNPQGVNYHIGSDGANVGLNFNTTVRPGQSILYRWFAEEEFGLGMLHDRADVQSHLHHGLYGALIIEPSGSTYLDPQTGQPLRSGEQAVIVDPNGPDFRENVVLLNSDLALFRSDGSPVPDNEDLAVGPSQEADDPEDQGEFSVNYRNEPWNHRFADNRDLSQIFSSLVHGDPDTPVFQAYPGDFVRFRVGQAVGDPRSTGFALHGHRWQRSPDDPGSQLAAFQGQFNPAVRYNIHLDPSSPQPHPVGGAGGPNQQPGDYLYRSNTLIRHLPGGQWGIFRVLRGADPSLVELPDNPAPPPSG